MTGRQLFKSHGWWSPSPKGWLWNYSGVKGWSPWRILINIYVILPHKKVRGSREYTYICGSCFNRDSKSSRIICDCFNRSWPCGSLTSAYSESLILNSEISRVGWQRRVSRGEVKYRRSWGCENSKAVRSRSSSWWSGSRPDYSCIFKLRKVVKSDNACYLQTVGIGSCQGWAWWRQKWQRGGLKK